MTSFYGWNIEWSRKSETEDMDSLMRVVNKFYIILLDTSDFSI